LIIGQNLTFLSYFYQISHLFNILHFCHINRWDSRTRQQICGYTDPAFYIEADTDSAFHIDADPDPAFQFGADPDSDSASHFCADPDPASQNDAEPCGSEYAGLPESAAYPEMVLF
jgi:hypothetical protein